MSTNIPPKQHGREEPKSNDPSGMPKKKFYRQRAHANPFSDHILEYPRCPEEMDWNYCFPGLVNDAASREKQGNPEVEILDIGCGFGGLLVALAPLLPTNLILGLEIRSQVTEFVRERIRVLRVQNADSGLYQNVACLRTNCMKFLPNFFRKGQLSKIFVCFPDPHFKARKHKARIVTASLNSEYAYILQPAGIVYTITDVEDLHEWIVQHFDSHPSFERVCQEDEKEDLFVNVMMTGTEEGQKVERNMGKKFVALYRRLEDPPW